MMHGQESGGKRRLTLRREVDAILEVGDHALLHSSVFDSKHKRLLPHNDDLNVIVWSERATRSVTVSPCASQGQVESSPVGPGETERCFPASGG
jgi:hypothetical protein